MGYPFSGGQLSLFVLAVDRTTTSGVKGFFSKLAELLDSCLGTHVVPTLLVVDGRPVGLLMLVEILGIWTRTGW